MGQEFDIPKTIVPMRGLEDGSEGIPAGVLVPQRGDGSGFNTGGCVCVLGWAGDPVRVDSCLSPSEPWDKLQHPIIQIRNNKKQNLDDGLKVLLLLRYFNS